jgi:membrane-bound metal-dependent hydrolase YbcI (DUF457 family)
MQPLGHLSISYILAKSAPCLSTPAIMAGGVLPDADFALLPFPWFGKIHRVVTHNFAFIALASLAGAAVAPRGRKHAVGWGLLLGSLVHLLIDADMFIGSQRGEGCALLYPFDSRQISHFRFRPPREEKPSWQDPVKDLKKSFRGMDREIPYLLAALLVWGVVRRRKAPGGSAPY